MQRWAEKYGRYTVSLEHPRGGFLYQEGDTQVLIDSEQGKNGMLIYPDSINRLNPGKDFGQAEIIRIIRNLSLVLEQHRFPFTIEW